MTISDERTVLYRFYGADDQLLYIGITNKPGVRWDAHMKQQAWWPDVTRQTAEWYPTREAALQAERLAIQDERPLYNVMYSVGLSALRLAEPWACPMCRWETTDPIEMAEHMEREVVKLAARRGTSEALERLARSVEKTAATLTKAEVALARSRALLAQAANDHRKHIGMARASGMKRSTMTSPAEIQKAMEDLDQILGSDRVRLSEAAMLLRRHDPDWPPYQYLRGTDLAAALKSRGVRITNAGNVPRLDPNDLRKMIS